jgi:sporulation protein YunB
MMYTAAGGHKRQNGKSRRGRSSRPISVRKRIGIALLIIVLFAVVGTLLLDLRVRPIIEKTTQYQAGITAEGILNAAIADVIDEESFTYDDLVTVKYDESGKVTAIEANMRLINQLKSRTALVINEEIKQIEHHDLNISLGTALGIHMFYGRGPSIPIKLMPKGYADTQILSSFTSAGINQTLHRIIITVTTDISTIIPGYTSSVTVKTTFVVAETVIVGTVPEAFTNVLTAPENLVDTLNDFGSITHYDPGN